MLCCRCLVSGIKVSTFMARAFQPVSLNPKPQEAPTKYKQNYTLKPVNPRRHQEHIEKLHPTDPPCFRNPRPGLGRSGRDDAAHAPELGQRGLSRGEAPAQELEVAGRVL